MNINNTVVHDDNSVLEGFKNYNSTSVENLKNAPKALNKSSINILIIILTILKVIQVSKAAGLGSLSGCFLKDGAS